MIISSPIASDSALDSPSMIPPRTRSWSAMLEILECKQRQLPAVVIDPLRREHAVVRPGEEQSDEGQEIGGRPEQPPGGQG